MPTVIRLAAEPSQELRITLAGQLCKVRVYAKEVMLPILDPGVIITDPPTYADRYPLFLDLYVNDALVVGGTRCYNNNKIVRNSYLGFVGDLAFWDSFGDEDPHFSELGTRFNLFYWPAAELT